MTLRPLPSVRRIHATLPIFRLDEGDRVLFYTPGQVRVTSRAGGDAVESALHDVVTPTPDVAQFAGDLVHGGTAARRAWSDLSDRPFAPECLTVYLSNRCNLACVYCYAAPIDQPAARNRRRLYPRVDADFPLVDPQVAYAAARLVAAHCARKEQRLTLVIHGGGEPTLHWDLLVRVRVDAERAAQEHGILTSSYIATNGVMPEARARWLAHHFSKIGLSCDGPPDMQNVTRPTGSGADGSVAVERTARAFAEVGCAYTVRATIVPTTVHRQREIVAYACDRLGASVLRFEPAYDARRARGAGFGPADAERFVGYFLEACDEARARGCDLQLSGVRPTEVHGPFCNPLRDVLQLTPDGVASGCFLESDGGSTDARGLPLGAFDATSQSFVMNEEAARAFRRRAARIPTKCESCVNVHHCARDCPDVCLINESPEDAVDGFRCRVQKLLGVHAIWVQASAAGQERDIAMPLT